MIERDYIRHIETLYGLISTDLYTKDNYATSPMRFRRDVRIDRDRITIILEVYGKNKVYLGFNIRTLKTNRIDYIYKRNPPFYPDINVWFIDIL